jgi:BTB/POZ domain
MSRSITMTSEQSPTDGRQVWNHPHADIVLRSRDSREFRVPKVYIVDSSPVLAEKIRTPSYPPRPSTSASPIVNSAAPLPVVELSDSGGILTSLLSFIIPMPAEHPSTLEDIMELLSTAQKYEMDLVLTRIRDHIARQNPPLIRDENAFNVYSLAQKYGLRREADQAARLTLKVLMSIEDLESSGKLDVLSGALLHRLWEYHQRVREYLTGDFTAFMMLGAGARINFRCIKLSSSDVPIWLSDYINSVAINPALFNLSEFRVALMRHVIPSSVPRSSRACPSCASISANTIDTFWTALSDVVQHSIENVSFSAVHQVLGLM